MVASSVPVALAMSLHERDGWLISMMQAQLPALVSRYAAVVAFCSQETPPAVSDLLRGHGVAVHIDPRASGGIEGMGHVRRETVRVGLAAGRSHLHVCDFDRAMHWIAHYPEELSAVVEEIGAYDLLMLGRTPRAWATHPPYQAETEAVFNQVFWRMTGLAWDIGTGSRGLSRRAAEMLLSLSRDPTLGADAEWPVLLLGQPGLRLGYRACEGLEFETGDRFGPEIEAAGSYDAWQAQMSADPQRWVFRLRVALMLTEALHRYGRGKGAQSAGW